MGTEVDISHLVVLINNVIVVPSVRIGLDDSKIDILQVMEAPSHLL